MDPAVVVEDHHHRCCVDLDCADHGHMANATYFVVCHCSGPLHSDEVAKENVQACSRLVPSAGRSHRRDSDPLDPPDFRRCFRLSCSLEILNDDCDSPSHLYSRIPPLGCSFVVLKSRGLHCAR